MGTLFNKYQLIQELDKIQLPDCDYLLIVPPFMSTHWPSLGLHNLQTIAKKKGHKVNILYSNIILERLLPNLVFRMINEEMAGFGNLQMMLSDRFFSHIAFNLPRLKNLKIRINEINEQIPKDLRNKKISIIDLLKSKDFLSGKQNGDFLKEYATIVNSKYNLLDENILNDITLICEYFLDILSLKISKKNYKVVGCSAMFDYCPSLALLKSIKDKNKKTRTILGGAACNPSFVSEIESWVPYIDHIFTGESETSFIEFLDSLDNIESKYNSKIISSKPNFKLNDIPCPIFDDYFNQINYKKGLKLVYETSRGCWWGQKHHCSFCGIDDILIQYRTKSAENVFEDLNKLNEKYSDYTNDLVMFDYIMPHEYHKTLIPLLKKEKKINIFYEQKANLSFRQLTELVDAGINRIQPGIESFYSDTLELMNKGVKGYQNLELIRLGTIAGIKDIHYHIVYGLPNEKAIGLIKLIKLIPKIIHLQPPGMAKLSIDRYSPYFENQKQYSITNVRPLDSYQDIFPKDANVFKLAYHFTAKYPSEVYDNKKITNKLYALITLWYNLYQKKKIKQKEIKSIKLELSMPYINFFILIDSRMISKTKSQVLNFNQVKTVLIREKLNYSKTQKWAIENDYCVEMDGYSVPLVTCKRDLYEYVISNKENKILSANNESYLQKG